MSDRSRQFSGLLRNGAEDRRSRRAGRPSKQARFIAIEKRITTRYREAQALTMPVTCHHCFEPCRHVLSSKLAGTHPPSTYLHIPCHDQWTLCSISDPIGYTCPPATAIPGSVARTSRICRLFVLPSCGFSHSACRDWSSAVDYPKRLLCRWYCLRTGRECLLVANRFYQPLSIPRLVVRKHSEKHFIRRPA